MRIMLKKSVADEICRYWGFPLVQKSVRDPKFEYFKRKILAHLDELERKEKAEMRKSLAYLERLEKGQKREVGDIVTWGRKVKHEYIKGADGKWRRYYRGTSRGQKLSIAALKRKVDACRDVGELWDLVFANWGRFMDADKMPLPVVRELHAYASKREDEINAAERKEKEEREQAVIKMQRRRQERREGNPDAKYHDKDVKKLANQLFDYSYEPSEKNKERLRQLCNKVYEDEISLYGNYVSSDNPLEIAKGVFLISAYDTSLTCFKTNDEGKKTYNAYKQREMQKKKIAEQQEEKKRQLEEEARQLEKEKAKAILEKDERERQAEKDVSAKMPVDIARRKEQAIANGAKELIKEFSNKKRLTMAEIKILFDYGNTDVATARLFDAVYEKTKNEHFDILIEPLQANIGGIADAKGWVKYNSELYKTSTFKGRESHVFLHELIHHVTMNALFDYEQGGSALNAEQKQACQTLVDVFDSMGGNDGVSRFFTYGLTNVYEMVAELANPKFREELKKKNLWMTIVDAVAKIVGVFKKGCKAASALETAEGALYKLLDNYKPYGGKGEGEGKPLAFKAEREGKHRGKELAFDVGNIPDAEFENPTKDFELKPLSDRFFEVTKTQKKPLLLKHNILLKNKTHHPEISTTKASKKILSQALYGNNVVMLCKPKDKPNYWSVVKEGSEYYVSVIDTDPAKKYNEIVGWRKIDKKKYNAMKKRVREEDGQFLITEETKDFSSRAADLSALPPDKQSIPHSTKKSSRFPRLMVRKSVARQILRQEHPHARTH